MSTELKDSSPSTVSMTMNPHPERIQRLERLRTADRHSLPLILKAEILRELQRLELVLGMIQTIETERDAIVSAKSKSQQTSAKKIKHLVKLKSIGPEFATVLVGEVFYRTFDNRKQVGELSLKVGDGGNREGGISWGC